MCRKPRNGMMTSSTGGSATNVRMSPSRNRILSATPSIAALRAPSVSIAARALQRAVVSVLRPVAGHARQHDLAGAEINRRPTRPLHGVDPRRRAAALDHDLPAAVARARVDRDDDALRPELERRVAQHVYVTDVR